MIELLCGGGIDTELRGKACDQIIGVHLKSLLTSPPGGAQAVVDAITRGRSRQRFESVSGVTATQRLGEVAQRQKARVGNNLLYVWCKSIPA